MESVSKKLCLAICAALIYRRGGKEKKGWWGRKCMVKMIQTYNERNIFDKRIVAKSCVAHLFLHAFFFVEEFLF